MIFEKYIGIPFEDKGQSENGADCYGILRLIYKNEYNIEIPEFKSSCYNTRAIFLDYMRQISECWEKVKEPIDGCVIAMAHDPQHPSVVQHFGIYIGDGKMLHTLDKIGSHVIKVSDMSYYIRGFYKWKK